MNKRKLEKSQRDHKLKRRRSVRLLKKKVRLLKKKFYDIIDKMNEEELDRGLTYMKRKKVFKQVHQYFAAKIIQKNFRGYMVRKNN